MKQNKSPSQSPPRKVGVVQLPMNRSPSPEEKRQSPKKQEGPDRECMINYTDDPGVLHRGEILPFATKKKWEN